MAKPRLSTGRIPFHLGIGVDTPASGGDFVGDVYYYDRDGAVGPTIGAMLLVDPFQYTPIGNVGDGVVQADPAQMSAVGAIGTGTVQASTSQPSAVGSVDGADVQPEPAQHSPTGPIDGGVVVLPGKIL